jgi:dihydroneopterin aldolase/2-amino-4-hydroxy-6-hydroxymethyldihydropteridine diphosphokinase/dihydropteroate synthase
MSTQPPPSFSDSILISSLRLHATIGPDRWLKRRPQPISLSISLTTSLAAAGRTDSVTDSIHYGDLAKELRRLLDGASAPSLRALAEGAAVVALAKAGAAAVRIDAAAENQFLHAERLTVQIGRANVHGHAGAGEVAEQRGGDRECVQQLALSVIIGVNPPEREHKQVVKTDVTFHGPTWEEPDWHLMHEQLVKVRLLIAGAFVNCRMLTSHSGSPGH